jgi:hypothetical protein
MYLHHHIRGFLGHSSYLKHLNKFILFSKKLDLGIEYKVPDILYSKDMLTTPKKDGEAELIISRSLLSNEKEEMKSSNISSINSKSIALKRSRSRILRPLDAGKLKSADEDWIMRDAPKLLQNKNFNFGVSDVSDLKNQNVDGDKTRFKHVSRKEKLDRFIKTEDLRHRNKSLARTPSDLAKDSMFLNSYYQKSEQKEDPDDIGVRNFKKNLASSNVENLQEEEIFDKRTIEPSKGSFRHNYFVFPISHCDNCRINFKTADTKTFIEKGMPEKKD